MKKMSGNKKNAVLFLILSLGLFLQPGNTKADELLPERSGVATMKGSPVTLLGPEITVGQTAPEFVVQATDLSDARLSQFEGKVKLIASVPSVDTPVCDAEVRRFNQEAAAIPGAAVIFISMDLPFAQKRFCGAHGIRNVQTFSDHRTADFGLKYGVLIKDARLLSRAIFILDPQNTVRYVEYVRENATHPDYDKALKTLREIGSGKK